MNKKISIVLTVLMLLTTVVGVLKQPIKAEDSYTISIKYSAEGYNLKGLETPLKGEAEQREIRIEPTDNKELTVDNFEVVITNPNRPPRTIYSSIVWLGENKG